LEGRVNYYHYHDKDGLIRIKARVKPTEKYAPKSGTWIVEEFIDGKWSMPCFPEITWRRLSKLSYLGFIAVKRYVEPDTQTIEGMRDEKETG
jgi:hypothetical protein